MPTTPQTADRSAARRGFTLTELMVVTVIIGITAAMSVPSLQRAIEQSRADIAGANLRAIWAAQRLYWLENHDYADTTTLRDIGLVDKEIVSVSGVGGYTYDVPNRTATAFTATATNTRGLGSYSINETGDVSGSITIGGIAITPGFQ